MIASCHPPPPSPPPTPCTPYSPTGGSHREKRLPSTVNSGEFKASICKTGTSAPCQRQEVKTTTRISPRKCEVRQTCTHARTHAFDSPVPSPLPPATGADAALWTHLVVELRSSAREPRTSRTTAEPPAPAAPGAFSNGRLLDAVETRGGSVISVGGREARTTLHG